MSPKKKTKAGAQLRAGVGERLAKALPRLPGTGDDRLTFSLQHADRAYDGAWSWCRGADVELVLDYLCDMSQLTWREIEAQRSGGHKKHHSQPIETLCPDAQKRLAELHLDETFEDDILRFRLANKRRLWGFRVGSVFHVVWWDANHAVYPTEPD